MNVKVLISLLLFVLFLCDAMGQPGAVRPPISSTISSSTTPAGTTAVGAVPISITITPPASGQSSFLDSTNEKVLLIIVTVLLTLLSTLLSAKLNRSIMAGRELKRLIEELADMKRHCYANDEILKQIDLSQGLPSAMHFEKMKIPESSILFSSETFRTIYMKHSRQVYELRLIVRNINIELEETVKYIATDRCKQSVVKEYIDYIKAKTGYIIVRIQEESELLEADNSYRFRLWMTKATSRVTGLLVATNRRTVEKKSEAQRPKHVVYTCKFVDGFKEFTASVTNELGHQANS